MITTGAGAVVRHSGSTMVGQATAHRLTGGCEQSPDSLILLNSPPREVRASGNSRDGVAPRPISLDEMEIVECSAQMACLLNGLWHSLLPKIHWSNVVRNPCYVCYIIQWRGAVCGVAIWSTPVAANRMKDGKECLELRRLALSAACPKNTASWALGRMARMIKVKFPQIKKLISYQDTSVHLGTIYKAANWKATEEVPLMEWNTETRKRSPLQSRGKKVRWEYVL